MDRIKQLERNILLLTLIKIFFKRSYLPIIAIFAVDNAEVSFAQIGVIAAIVSLTALVLEVPSGYISDKIGHKNALILGSVLVMFSPLWFVLSPNFVGVLLGSMFFFGGYAFHSGTLSAIIYDTLRELGRAQDFGQVTAHAQKIGLFFFVILVALVPISYQIHPLLPFFIGFISHSIVFIVSLLMTVPKKESHSRDVITLTIFAFLRKLASDGRIAFFFFVGLSTGIIHKLPEFQELYLQDIGVALMWFGLVTAVGNLLGALSMYSVKALETISHKIFYIIDMLVVITLMFVLGFLPFAPVIVGTFIILIAYSRLRQVVMSAHLVADCPTSELKATYLSVFEFFASFNRIWVPLVLGAVIGKFGISAGYGIFAIILTIILLLSFVFARRVWVKID